MQEKGLDLQRLGNLQSAMLLSTAVLSSAVLSTSTVDPVVSVSTAPVIAGS